MKTPAEIKAHALRTALANFFCNMDDQDWPADPMEVLVSMGFTPSRDMVRMMVWQPFENYSCVELHAFISDQATCIEAAIVWGQT